MAVEICSVGDTAPVLLPFEPRRAVDCPNFRVNENGTVPFDARAPRDRHPCNPRTLHRACPNCGRDNYGRVGILPAAEPWGLKRCDECRLVYLENVLDYGALVETFAWERTYESRREARRKGHFLRCLVSDALKRIKKCVRRGLPREVPLVRRLIPGGRLLDVGCGSGHVFRLLDERYVPDGIEISAELARQAAEVCGPRGGRVVCDSALGGLDQLEADSYDGVLMISYLEHEIQPREVLRAAWRVLKPDGLMIAKTPNYGSLNRRVTGARWCGYRFPDHVNYFTPATLSGMLRDCGFEVRRFSLRDRSPLGDNMWLVAGRSVEFESASLPFLKPQPDRQLRRAA
jgi:2-polyprenyl-3-methyl-5-hydroxy-6-metoxy-1,4-benzoquinol methylase